MDKLELEANMAAFEAEMLATDPHGLLPAPDYSTHLVRDGLPCYNDPKAEAAFCGWYVAKKAMAAPPPPDSGELAEAAAKSYAPLSFIEGAKWAQSSGELAKLREDAARYQALRALMGFTKERDEAPYLRWNGTIPAPDHDPHKDWVAGRFDASVDRAVDAYRAALPQDLAKEGEA